MARHKIDYGIDLGTTNSAIARCDNGQVKIIKGDEQEDVTPSCVQFGRKKNVIVGTKARFALAVEMYRSLKLFSTSDRNIFLEFKRTMGTDMVYQSSYMGKPYSSEELSSEVLKALRSYVRDDDPKGIVITVPAKFQQHQMDATRRAGFLAGFQHVELLQEPIAASLAYGVDKKNLNGHWLVFDFGGGTFDAALMKVDEGVMKVVDTDGDNHLGGKDLDYAIVDEIITPYLSNKYALEGMLGVDSKHKMFRDAVKQSAEEGKIKLSNKDSYTIAMDDPIEMGDIEFELEIPISLHKFETAVVPVFQRAIDLTKGLLSRNGLKGSELVTVILVGGPTFSQTLRRMMTEQISPNIDTTTDPMTAVAVGAALYASTRDIPSEFQNRDSSKIQLQLKYPGSSVETTENLGIRADRKLSAGNVPEKLIVEVSRADKGWSSGRIPLEDDAEIIEIQLVAGSANGFQVRVFDEKGVEHPCQPSEFSIIAGVTIARPTLGDDIAIEVNSMEYGRDVLISVKGLEKNTSLPAKGNFHAKIPQDIRPGNKADKFRIPIYSGREGDRAILHNWAGRAWITGEDLPSFVPKDSDVELTLEIDVSRNIIVRCFFPSIDETVSRQLDSFTKKTVDPDVLDKEIEAAHNRIEIVEDEHPDADIKQLRSLQAQLEDIAGLLERGRGDGDTHDKVHERLRSILIELDKIELAGEWPKVEAELREAIKHIDERSKQFGDSAARGRVDDIKKNAAEALARQDTKVAKSVIDQIRACSYDLVKNEPGLYIGFIKGFDDEFESHEWQDRRKARALIDEAKKVIATAPTVANLQPIVSQLFQLLPKGDMPISAKSDQSLLRK